MNYYLILFLFILIVNYTSTLPAQNSIQPLECTSCEMEKIDIRVREALMENARRKRDTYEYTYNKTMKTETTISWSMKVTDDGNGGKRDVINIGPAPEMNLEDSTAQLVNTLADVVNDLTSYLLTDDDGDLYDWWSW